MDKKPHRGLQGRPTCESCRQRKVRCNRRTPCSQCSRLQLSCVYETRRRRAPLKAPSGASPRTSPVSSVSETPSHSEHLGTHSADNQPTNRDILDRLSKVEEMLEDLVKRQDLPGPSETSVKQTPVAPRPVLVPPVQSQREKPKTMGEAMRSNYVDDSVFVGLLLDDAPRRFPGRAMLAVEPSTKATERPRVEPGFVSTDVFGSQVDHLCLSFQVYEKLWTFYLQNFDPLVKILHIPTIQPVILGASANPGEAEDITLALLYAVAFAATVTLQKSSSVDQLGYEKTTLLRHFMRQMDEAFMRAQFLLRPNTQSLTALVIYLVGCPISQLAVSTHIVQVALRNYDASRPLWILIGLAIRIAESLGVHEDGSRLGLNLFESEMRRRLWWHLIILDATAPENHGFNSTVVDRNRAISLPINTDDMNFSPGITEPPPVNEQWTKMSFSIMNLELCRSLRHAVAATANNETKVDMIREIESHTYHKWLRLADMTKETCRAADALLQISVLKAHFLLGLQTWLSTTVSTESKYCHLPQSSFTTAITLLENGYLLQSGKMFENFAWFFQQHPQLYALFLILRTLHASPGRPETERAWAAIDNYFPCLTEFEEASEMKGRTSCVWTVLGPLRERASQSCGKMGYAGQYETSSSIDRAKEGPKMNGTSVSPLPTVATDIPMSSQVGSQLALDLSAFDNVLAWQDFSDWFNIDNFS